MRLSDKQRKALQMAYAARFIGSREGRLVSAYGNGFFISGGTYWDGTCERNTLESLRKRGFLLYEPGLSMRGEYRLSPSGEQLVESWQREPN